MRRAVLTLLAGGLLAQALPLLLPFSSGRK
jgi:hypothetical protein